MSISDEDYAALVAERDRFRADSVLLNEMASKIGEALGYPARFSASPLALVDQLIEARLETQIRNEPMPSHGMYAVVLRGAYRYLVTLGPDALASWDFDYPLGWDRPPLRHLTLKGVVVDQRVVADHENPGRETRPQIPAAPAAITRKATK